MQNVITARVRLKCAPVKKSLINNAQRATIAAALLAAFPAYGQNTGTQTITVVAQKPVPVDYPNTQASVTQLQIEETINAVTVPETLQYLPSIHVRERYVGDRNAILVMRVNSSVASAQTTVYADGLLLSNFLNNSFSTAPRWGMVSPEEVDRIDVLYGPFSALYPGNSAGGVVNITTRAPKQAEAHIKVDYFTQRFKEYGTDDRFDGNHQSVSFGTVADNWTVRVAADRLQNRSQPQTFGNTTVKTGAPAAPGTFTDVSGSTVYRDLDTANKPRIIVSSLGIDKTLQEMGKVSVGYQISPMFAAKYTLGIWQNHSEGRVDSYLKDTNGSTVFNAGSTLNNPYKFIRLDGVDYTVSAAVPSKSDSEHWMHGVSLTAQGGRWDAELIASVYDQKKDESRVATPRNGLDSGLGVIKPGGQVTYNDGTGWQNIDLRGRWRSDDSFQQLLSLGVHADRYELSSLTFGTATTPIADWVSSTNGVLNTNSYGKTRTEAIYLQDEFRIAPQWTMMLGGRQEHWRAYDGSNYNAANVAPNPKNLVYPDRSYTDFSPKAHVAWDAAADLALRLSYGKGVRYPTVAEMFQTFNGPGGIRINDPNLKPERVYSTELSAQKRWERGMLRTSYFFEDKRDALISQTDVTVTPNISSIQNVDKLRTNGVEVVGELNDFWLRGLDLNGSVTYTNSKIIEDSRNPGLEGTDQPRIPDWRVTLVSLYHFSDALSLSLNYRFSGRQHNALFNTTTNQYNDPNPNVYGAVSHYSVFDTKLLYRIDKQWSASAGINNIGNFKYYVNPNPYPQRTFFASLMYDL
ncbi:MAG: TonB-dependent receptor [Rhodocyclaceae bacterium]|nr:TonB-dependent receptor [Rhodocyclaceae bacterium]